jgi:flagellar basal body rod protein FlgC
MDGMSSSVSGIQAASQSLGVTALKIANAPGPRPKALEQEAQIQPEPAAVRENQEAPNPGRDLAVEAMNLKADRVTYEANLQFLQVQSGLLGTALDMKA